MAKSLAKSTSNLLRLSGIIFAIGGTFHVLRYFFEWEFTVGSFELTYKGSLIIGILILILSFSCFMESRKSK